MVKKSTKKYVFAIAALIGILAVVMFVLPMIQYHAEVSLLGQKAYNEVNLSGFNLLAGAKDLKGITYNTITDKTTEYSFNTDVKACIGPIISFVLSIVGIIAVILSNFIGKKNKGIVKIVAFAAFVVAGVLAIALAKPTFISANDIDSNLADLYKISVGAYIVCGLDVAAGVCSLAA